MTDEFIWRPYQAQDFGFFLSHPRSLVLYEPRMGKTPLTAGVIGRDPHTLEVLIICPINALLVWEEHIPWVQHFSGDERDVSYQMVIGDAYDRKQMWGAPRKAATATTIRIRATTQASFLRDAQHLRAGQFDTIIIDEYHKWLLRKTKSLEVIRPFVREARRFHALSGTPAEKGPQQMFPILNLCDNRAFSSKYAFLERFGVWNENIWGGRDYIGLKDVNDWFKMMSQWSRIRFRDKEDMPSIQRAPQHVAMPQAIERLYAEMDKSGLTFTDKGEVLVAATSVEKTMRLRQLLACPAMLEPSLGVGGSLEHLVQELQEAESPDDRHIAIFTSFKRALPIWEQYIKQALKTEHVYLLHGSLEVSQLRDRIGAYKANKGIVICTTKYAQAFSLAGASMAAHIGWEWSASENKQAEDRVVGQTASKGLISRYYITQGTIEESVAEHVIWKHQVANELLRDPNSNATVATATD